IQAAEAGDLEAISTLGQFYSEGRPGLAPDYEKALHWFSIGEEKEDPSSLLGLATMYENGRGVEQDYDLALEYYTRAAEYGLAEAAYLLGYIFMNGTITDVRIPSGVFWMRIASNN